MIKKTYLVPVQETLICDKCGTEMLSGGTVLMPDPPQYPYYCPKCGEKTIFNENYPRIVYEVKSAAGDMF